jgi:hypothetical protein
MAREPFGVVPIPYQADMQPSICENYARMDKARQGAGGELLENQVKHAEYDEKADDENDADNPQEDF